MLGQQEQIAKLVLDEEWRGGEAVRFPFCLLGALFVNAFGTLRFTG